MSLKAKVLLQPMPDHTFEDTSDIVFPKRFRAWKLHNQMVTISFGHRKFDVHCKIHAENEDAIYISHSLSKQLLLPHLPSTLSLSYHKDIAYMSLGPVFAVLTVFNKKQTPVSFGAIDSFCNELSSFCSQHGLFFYVFSLDDFKDNEVGGYTYSNQMWQKHQLPLPNVIYNRIPLRKMERSELAKIFFEKCKELEIPFFNDRFLNKWEVHQMLTSELHLKLHLPETTIFARKSTFINMVKNFTTIYVKPIYGSQGKHIYRITRENENYILENSGYSSTNKQTFNDDNELYQAMKRKINNRKFLIQQGINLHEHKGRTVDFRVLCNRNYSGEWFVSSMMARLSPPKNFVSNVARGGELLKPEDVLYTYKKSEQRQIVKALQELALEFCFQIGKNFEGEYGELGVDLALDQEGNIWFIEVNVKPSKDMDGNISSLKVRPSAKAILQYGSYLANH
jgi:glutathione synthase/RimK-type ligase-like ATP-grasp enzyme